MALLIQPLNLGGDIREVVFGLTSSNLLNVADDWKCIDLTSKTTVVNLSDDATNDGGGNFTIYRSNATVSSSEPDPLGPEKFGSIIFGVTCASNVQLELEGIVETLDDGFEWIEVWHNGILVTSFSSLSDGLDDAWGTDSLSELVNIDVSEALPCSGHIIQVIGSTGDDIANNGVGWTCKITVT